MSLPSGTVTFLFTDIEGSTKLWEAHPAPMRAAVARHDALAASLIEGHEGTLVKSRGEGDSLFAVFARASDATAAACALQRALLAEPSPDGLRLRVRMALHTGEAELRGGDYFGPAVNRCARLRSVAHGGQVLLSLPTEELARDSLPEGAALLDLGEHRLRDLARPERVFQLLHPELPTEFPPPRSLDALPNNLPLQVTSFIGREKEITEARALLAKAPLLTITGSGGVGKTRLALQVAAEELDHYPDGVWLAELAPLSDPALVPQSISSVLGVREETGKPIAQTLLDHLKARHLLLVLDNCEHLIDACARLADRILRHCPRVRLLATSREALSIAGERPWRMPSLSLPDPGHVPAAGALTQYEAVRLFIDRATTVQPGFAVTNANAPALAQVCHRLDGIPLAIELAAARVRVLPVEQLAKRLDDRFRLLTGGSRTALPRQQTLRAAIDWSFDLLPEPERVLLGRLSVFSGGWSLESAEGVCAGEPVAAWDVLELLSRLVEKSLVLYEEPQAGEARYRLLETVRQYARDRLLESGESGSVRGRHRDHFLALAEEAEPGLFGPEQGRWLGRLEREHENLRAALEWCRSDEGAAQAGLRLAASLYRFWVVRGYFREGREWLQAMLERGGGSGPSLTRGRALNWLAVLAFRQGESSAVRRPWVEESIAIARQTGDKSGCARALNTLGSLLVREGDDAAARACLEEAVALSEETGERGSGTWPLYNLAYMAARQGDREAERTFLERSVAAAEETGDKAPLLWSLQQLGGLYLRSGDRASAHSCWERGLALCRELGDKAGVSRFLLELVGLAIQEGDVARSRSLFEESVAVARELARGAEDRDTAAGTLTSAGWASHRQGDLAVARSLFEEALTSAGPTGIFRADSLFHLGMLTREEGDNARARSLLDQSLSLSRAAGWRTGSSWALLELGRVAPAGGAPARGGPPLPGEPQFLRGGWRQSGHRQRAGGVCSCGRQGGRQRARGAPARRGGRQGGVDLWFRDAAGARGDGACDFGRAGRTG